MTGAGADAGDDHPACLVDRSAEFPEFPDDDANVLTEPGPDGIMP